MLVISREYIINSRKAMAGAIIGLLFFKFKQFELYWGAVFFKICSHIFITFEVELGIDFVHAENGSRAKKRVLCCVKFTPISG